jgi:hypothetical protein
MTESQRAASVGSTGGLPGANAAPRTAELAADELDDTVATGASFEDSPPDDSEPVDDAEAIRIARNGGYLEED